MRDHNQPRTGKPKHPSTRVKASVQVLMKPEMQVINNKNPEMLHPSVKKKFSLPK